MRVTVDTSLARPGSASAPTLRPRPDDTERQSHSPPQRPGNLAGLLREWFPVVAVTVGAGIVAFGASFLLPRTYISSAVFVPEQSKSAQLPASLGALAGDMGLLAGLGGGTDSPEFYQRLLAGRAIRTAILSKPLAGVNLFDYFNARARHDSLEKALKKLGKVTTVSIDKASGTVRIDAEFRKPELAEAVVTKYVDLVNDFNSSIRRTQAGKRRQFVEAQTNAALADLQRAEANVKDFLTRNRIVTAPELQFEKGQLDRRVSAAQDLYLALSRQLQTARIDEVNDTPVISVVDPPFLPVKASGPHRVVITLMAMFFGALLSTAYLLYGRAPRRSAENGD